MLFDQVLLDARRDRVCYDPASALLQSAWCDDPPERRAAMAAARGNLELAASIAAGPWKNLLEKDLVGALRGCRSNDAGTNPPAMDLAQAETLITAGAIIAGLDRLAGLHQRNYGPASVAFARHCYQFGDWKSAMTVAKSMPEHAQLALTGAKAALSLGALEVAAELLAPYLLGAFPVLDALDAGSYAVIAASLLAKRRNSDLLQQFAAKLLHAPDAPQEMFPAISRAAWCAGMANEAWKRFDPQKGPWATAARLELAVLSGDVEMAARLYRQAGPQGMALKSMLTLLTGGEINAQEASRIFTKGKLIHIWRTHPYRWQSWIDALEKVEAKVGVYDLPGGVFPDQDELPDVLLDDGALAELIEPVPAQTSKGGTGIWIESTLCIGVGIGHDWPESENKVLSETIGEMNLVNDPTTAAVRVASAETALALARDGRPVIALAPPGEAYWAGPLPNLGLPAIRVLKAKPTSGWTGCGKTAAELALSLLADSNS